MELMNDLPGWLGDFLNWAWARHHNILSWYIRPLFLLPFCYFAYRRSALGIVLTIVALATSMFWFPVPAQPDPQVTAFLQDELVWITSPWTPLKWALTLATPICLGLLAAAFWARSWSYGLALLNAITLIKALFSVGIGQESSWSIMPALAVGMLVLNATVIYGARWFNGRHIGGQHNASI
jgi:hypothetical protein